jgi:sedoheptulose-bisphosphatase
MHMTLACVLQIEKAGGYSSCDGKCVSGLDVPIEKYDQRTQICYGSLAEVRPWRV